MTTERTDETPRWMKPTTAARYMDMCPNTFREKVAPHLTEHTVPGTNQKRYDREEIDRVLAGEDIIDPARQKVINKVMRAVRLKQAHRRLQVDPNACKFGGSAW